MNNKRRRRIDALLEKLGQLEGELSEIKEEEQEAFDNLPESIQASERGEAMQEALDNLEYATDNIEEIRDNLITAKGD